MGKGDGRRVEDQKKIDANWDQTFGKKVDAHGPTWTDTTPPTLTTIMCDCGHSADEHMPDCCVCRAEGYSCACTKDQTGVLLAALVAATEPRDAEIIIGDYDEYRELQREARIARHLKSVLPLIYAQMEKELAGAWPASPGSR